MNPAEVIKTAGGAGEEPPRYIEELKTAIKDRNIDAVMAALAAIDKEVTGALLGTFAERPDASPPEVRREVQKFLEDLGRSSNPASVLVYLGDGGFSRLSVYRTKDGSIGLELTNSSTKSAKERWAKLQSNETPKK